MGSPPPQKKKKFLFGEKKTVNSFLNFLAKEILDPKPRKIFVWFKKFCLNQTYFIFDIYGQTNVCFI